MSRLKEIASAAKDVAQKTGNSPVLSIKEAKSCFMATSNTRLEDQEGSNAKAAIGLASGLKLHRRPAQAA